jgi:hypothetical protein
MVALPKPKYLYGKGAQMYLSKKRALCAGIGITAIVASIASYANAHKPYGQMTKEQVLSRSTKICSMMEPQLEKISFNAVPEMVHTLDGESKRVWLIDGSDSKDEFAAMLMWDADTGDLVSASHPPVPPRWGADQAMNSKDAVGVARDWLRTLGVNGRVAWTLSEKPEKTIHLWFLTFYSGYKKAVVAIDALSGNLVKAIIVPRSVRPAMKQAVASAI